MTEKEIGGRRGGHLKVDGVEGRCQAVGGIAGGTAASACLPSNFPFNEIINACVPGFDRQIPLAGGGGNFGNPPQPII